jgi:ubiquinone/menaquinone biosynthesis C-methylase UbiE
VLTPRRRRGVEILDDPSVDPAIRARSIGDVTRSNRLLGGRRAALTAFRDVLPLLGRDATLLDVGTGLADLPAAAARLARRVGVAITAIGLDEAPSLLAAAGPRLDLAICADALRLPLRDDSVDVVLCSQVLHHFESREAEALLRELDRVARRAVIVSDLHRSWIAAAGFWLVSFPLRFHAVTRHDGVVSVLRGFTARELERMIGDATGARPIMRRRLGYRLTARWTPGRAA